MIVRDHPSPIDDQSEEFKVNLFFLRPDIGIASLMDKESLLSDLSWSLTLMIFFEDFMQQTWSQNRFHLFKVIPVRSHYGRDLERVKLINVNNYSS